MNTPDEGRDELERLRAEHRAALEELEQRRALAELGLLAAGVMHDLNNVLHVVSAHAGAVRTRAHGRDAEALDQVLEAAREASALTRQLLEWARRAPSRPEPTDVSALTGDVLDLLDTSAPPSVRLERRLEPALPPVLAHPVDLRRIVLNLVVNAWDACTGREGLVRVATGRADGQVWLEVADDGRGMDAETQARAFDPFFSTRERGTGVGLDVVRRLVERHEGRIELASTPGQGATFRVTLPAMAARVSA